MMHTYEASYKQTIIRPLLKKDIELMRIWRNNSILSRYLKPIGKITPEMQLKWFKNYIIDNNILFFSITNSTDGIVVGSLAIYGISNGIAEIGKIIIGDPLSHGKGLGYVSLVMAMQIGFEKLCIDYFTLNCHEDNVAALKSYLRAGFTEKCRHLFIKGGYEIEMSINKYEFQKRNTIINDIHIK
jgi:Acetyltransferases, including N-acetylases of ribosomal proteins